MRQKFELSDVIRQFGEEYKKQNNPTAFQMKVLSNIASCRTSALGGHEDKCDCCGKSRYSYNSCRDRHCPKCQSAKQAFWIDDLMQNTLPIKHYHLVFTVPHDLNKLCLLDSRWFYDHLFAAVWHTLRLFGYSHFGAETGAVCVLHTWGQNLSLHPHIHCIVPAAGFSIQGKWKSIGEEGNFLYPVKQLSVTFKGKFMDGLKRHLKKQDLLTQFQPLLNQAYGKNWNVHCEPSLAKADHVVKYLGQYTHRVAITNQRILNITNDEVKFIAKDYQNGSVKKAIQLDGVEFIRRFCLHILPYRFVKIRRYGIYNPTVKRNLQLQFVPEQKPDCISEPIKTRVKETAQQRLLRLTGVDVYKCPFCANGTMHTIRELPRIRAPSLFASLPNPTN